MEGMRKTCKNTMHTTIFKILKFTTQNKQTGILRTIGHEILFCFMKTDKFLPKMYKKKVDINY